MQCLVDSDHDCRMVQQKILKARKEHKCCECGKVIVKGEQFEHYTGSFEGDFFHHTTCLVCVEVRDHFCCGWTFGQVLEDIEYALSGEDDLNLGCVDGLSPAALDVILPMLESVWEERE